MVDNKGFSYWTNSSDALKSNSLKQAAPSKKKQKQPEPKKEKPAPAEHVKPLAVA